MTNKAMKYGLMSIAAVLLVAMAFAGAASALDPYTDSTVKLWVNESTDTGIHFHLNESKTLDEVKAIYGMSNAYKISSEEDLYDATISNNESIFILTQDIYCITPRTSAVISTFNGTLIGNGYTIYNLTIDSNAEQIGLVERLGEHGTLNYVTLMCANISSEGNHVGGLVGIAYSLSNITGCNIKHSDITCRGSEGDRVGGLVGSTDINCVRIENCSVENSSISSGSYNVGGLVGSANSGSIMYNDVKNCMVTGGVMNIGGLTGRTGTSNTKVEFCKVKNCMVIAGNNRVGGLTGYVTGYATFVNCNAVNCTVVGTNTGSNLVGGLLGYEYESHSNFNGCNAKDCVVAGDSGTINELAGYGNIPGAAAYNVIVDKPSTAGYQINITRIGETTSADYHVVNSSSKLKPAIEMKPNVFFTEKVSGQTYGYAYKSYNNTTTDVYITSLGVYGTPSGFGYFEPTIYTVTYNGNGNASGSVPVDSALHVANTEVTVLGNINNLAKPGYNFTGWNMGSVTGALKQAGETFQITANTYIYANWTPYTYNVTFSNTTGTGIMTNQTFTYDVAESLKPNTFTKSGFTFAGWNKTSADGTVVDFVDQASVLNLTDVDNSAVHLYAIWTANTYTVHFDANGGQGSMADMTFTYDVGQNLTANAFQRYNSNFLYWTYNGTKYYNTEFVKNLTNVSGDSVTMTAQWETYSTGGGSSGTSYLGSNNGSVIATQQPTVKPTVAPTAKPTEKPATPTVIATEKPTTQATTSKSPAPFVGILAGLGAAAVLLRLRK